MRPKDFTEMMLGGTVSKRCAFEPAPLLQFDSNVWFVPPEGHTKQEVCEVLCNHNIFPSGCREAGPFQGADRALEGADKPGQAGAVGHHTSSH